MEEIWRDCIIEVGQSHDLVDVDNQKLLVKIIRNELP